jgi:transposase
MTNLADLPKDVQDYIRSLEVRYTALEERYQLLLYKRFCRAAETVDKDQPLLFDVEASDTKVVPETEPAETEEIKSYTRKKSGRKAIDDSLQRQDVVIDIPESEKQCACGCALVRIGEEVSERLQVIPARMWVPSVST